MTLKVGSAAPPLSYAAADGTPRTLAELRGHKAAVVYFYPADFTSVCTRETCGFRDIYGELASADVEVIGVSVDDPERHREFAEAYQIPFALVSDPNLEIARAWGATGLISTLARKTKRVTYVVDKAGTIAGVFEGMFSASHHVDGVRARIAELPR
ncbi:MAG: peroxiredoxin [Kofleriaceae bacterium]